MTPPPQTPSGLFSDSGARCVCQKAERFGTKFGIDQVMEKVVLVSRVSGSSLYRPLLAVSPLSLPTWSVAQAAGVVLSHLSLAMQLFSSDACNAAHFTQEQRVVCELVSPSLQPHPLPSLHFLQSSPQASLLLLNPITAPPPSLEHLPPAWNTFHL